MPCEMMAVILGGREDAADMEELTTQYAAELPGEAKAGKRPESPELAGKLRDGAPGWSGLFIQGEQKR